MIQRVLRYPNQHAVLWTDVPHSTMPLPYGCLARMKVLRAANAADTDFFRNTSYASSLNMALNRAYEDARQCGLIDAQVLRDHMQGILPRSRARIIRHCY